MKSESETDAVIMKKLRDKNKKYQTHNEKTVLFNTIIHLTFISDQVVRQQLKFLQLKFSVLNSMHVLVLHLLMKICT